MRLGDRSAARNYMRASAKVKLQQGERRAPGSDGVRIGQNAHTLHTYTHIHVQELIHNRNARENVAQNGGRHAKEKVKLGERLGGPSCNRC